MVINHAQADKSKQSESDKENQLSSEGLSVDELSSADFSFDKSVLGMSDSSDNNTVQKKAVEEEEPLQMKGGNSTETESQAIEEEEPLQMKGGNSTEQESQMVEEEEPLQMKGGNSTEQESQMVEEEEPLQMKGGHDKEEDKPLQFKAGAGDNSRKDPSAMPAEVLTKMESSFGADFSDVNIHSNSSKASQVGALAYTQGNDIHFAPGQFQPGTKKGQELLGHELTHVVQQRNGNVKPTTQAGGQAVNNSPALEKEADVMGAKAAKGQSTSVAGKGSGIQKQDADGSGKHGELEASWTDYLEIQKWYQVADVAETLGLVNAARHMRHYLGNSGSPLNVDADSMLRDLPQLATRFRNEIALAKQEAQTRIANGEKSFTITGTKKNHYATKSQSSDWFFAIGGYTYWLTAKVNVKTGRDGQAMAEMSSQLHVFDRYNWDKGKSVTIAGIEVTDESLGRLHKVGLAQEYEVNGVSSENELEWEVANLEALKLEDIEVDEGRRDRRTDPTRSRR